MVEDSVDLIVTLSGLKNDRNTCGSCTYRGLGVCSLFHDALKGPFNAGDFPRLEACRELEAKFRLLRSLADGSVSSE